MSSLNCYPGTNILINNPGIKEQIVLDKFEQARTALRMEQLQIKPIKGTFGLDHLKSIHQYIFQDVYPFAGKIRETNISKNGFQFAEYRGIEFKAGNVFMNLKEDRYLKGLTEETYAKKAAQYYSDINYIHLFREGNGRAIREFFKELSKNAGYDLQWSQVSKDDYMTAVKATDNPSEIMKLTDVIYKCIQPKSSLEMEQWIIPDKGIKLKDALKMAEGLPSLTNEIDIDSKMLNQVIDRFRIFQNDNSETFEFQLDGSDQQYSVKLEKVKYLSQELKNEWLDRSSGLKQMPQINKGLELGG